MLVFSGGVKLDSIPRMKATNLQMGSIASIGDVSEDGINDVAIEYNNFGIVKGIDLTKTNIAEGNITPDFLYADFSLTR